MAAETKVSRAALLKLLAAFAIVYVIWGSTYLAIAIAIDTIPPLAMAGARFVIAGSVLYAFLRLRGVPNPEPRQWRAAGIVGALLLVGGNGCVVMAERTVPSGIVALLVATVPLWMVLLEWLRPGGGVRPARRTFVGLAVGFAGMVLLVGPGELSGGGGVPLGGAAIVFAGSLSWAFGSIWARQAPMPKNPLMATAVEMLSAGVLLTVIAGATGELSSVGAQAVTLKSLLALGYLIVFGSLVAFSAYVWLLRATTPALVSTYAYVNPVVAVFLGWLVLGEPVTGRTLLAAAVIIAAVAIITIGGKRPAEDAPAKVLDEGAAASPLSEDAEIGGAGKTARASSPANLAPMRKRASSGGR
ncbi:MAG TPA: drug/metabolite exporter YedA [Longimicrobiaceae bacterium]|jgi:drug/metabolite transporter (DMT)-like permease|nr:drug/metabolite exporter YedA [Longimicrobiaceae bacterium]